MKQNPNKLADLLEKQNEGCPPADSQMNFPYQLKKRNEPEPISSKDIAKQQKTGNKLEEEKNKKTMNSFRFLPFKDFFFLFRHQIKSKLRASHSKSF
jgi:hypothetical protein